MDRIHKALNAIGSLRLASNEYRVSVSSDSNLGLDMTETATTMESTEEINTTPTSISTYAPAGVGSTAQVTISGEYDGSNGAGTLRFTVNNGGAHGEDNLQIKVFDSADNELDQIDIKKKDAIDKEYTLSNGLTLSLGAGAILKDDEFTVAVDDSAPASFSPTQPDWTGANAPITLGGAYDGSNGSDTLIFQVNSGGTHGVDDIQIKVFDSGNDQIDQE